MIFYGVERDGGVPFHHHPKQDGDVLMGASWDLSPSQQMSSCMTHACLSEVVLLPTKPLQGRKVWFYPAALGWPNTRVFFSSTLPVPSHKPVLNLARYGVENLVVFF